MKIKVEGYINTADFEGEDDLFDPDHGTGLSEKGMNHFALGPLDWLESVRFTRS